MWNINLLPLIGLEILPWTKTLTLNKHKSHFVVFITSILHLNNGFWLFWWSAKGIFVKISQSTAYGMYELVFAKQYAPNHMLAPEDCISIISCWAPKKTKSTTNFEKAKFSKGHNCITILRGERGGSVVEGSERLGVLNLPPPCCVLEQDTLLPESTG